MKKGLPNEDSPISNLLMNEKFSNAGKRTSVSIPVLVVVPGDKRNKPNPAKLSSENASSLNSYCFFLNK